MDNNIIVMGEEPIPGLTPEDIQNWYNENRSEKALAQAFAVVSNKFWWVEDNEYDYEEGSIEHKKVCETTQLWGNLMDQLKAEIFVILKSEGVNIPETKQIDVLEPFMTRNGFYDGNGWWIKNPEIS